MRASYLRPPFTAFAVSIATLGCGDPTRPGRQPELPPRFAAGSYVLAQVSGRGPVSGTFLLTSFGRAERRVRYAEPSGVPSGEYVAKGTFRLYGDSIAFALDEKGPASSFVWHVRGARSALGFSIRHPDPADGPDIVETYRRR